jgi:hypothetical protein
MNCSLEPVVVGGTDWDEFLVWSVNYIAKYWPESAEGRKQEALLCSYEKELKGRVSQGGRGLFFLAHEDSRVGIANVYIASGDSEYFPKPVTTLFIAEFYVTERRQREGLGKCFLDLVVQWGLNQGAEALVVEVDKDLRQANLFWSAFGMRRLMRGERNLYVSFPMRRL